MWKLSRASCITSIGREQRANYGRRLLPHLVDEIAGTAPNRLYATISSSHFPTNWLDVSFAKIANRVNYHAHFLQERISLSDSFETLYYVGIPDLRSSVVFLAAIKVRLQMPEKYHTPRIQPIPCPSRFLISPRNPIATNTSLLEQTVCTKVFYSVAMAPNGLAVCVYRED